MSSKSVSNLTGFRSIQGWLSPWYDYILAANGFAVGMYITLFYPEIMLSGRVVTPDKVAFGAIAILLGLEVTVVPRLVGALGTWAVAIANLLSAAVMFWFLLRRRPEAIARLREGWTDQS